MRSSQCRGLGKTVSVLQPNVTCVSHGFLPEYERGFCNGLASQNISVTLIGSDRTDVVGLDARIRTINLRGSQDENRSRWRKAWNLLRYNTRLLCYSVMNRDEVFHVIGSIQAVIWYGLILGLWFRLVGKKYLLTIHNLLPHDKHTSFNRLVFRLAYQLPSLLVAHTERMKRDLVEHFAVDIRRIVVMKHGLEPIPRSLQVVRSSQKQDVPPTLLAFGRLAPYKGTDVLFEALHRVSFDFRLIVAGPCADLRFRARLKALEKDLSLVEKVEWRMGYLPESEMDILFATSDLVVLPYRHIDQSGVLFQAMRFGVPIVASRVGDFEADITAELGELAKPGDIDDLVNALERWAARRHAMNREQIRVLAKSYEWSKTVEVLRAAYA